jgi:hypothetical protein
VGAANEARERERERERERDERFRETLRLFPLRSCSVLTLAESACLFFFGLRGLIAPLGSSSSCAFSGCFFLPFQFLFSWFQIRCNLVQNRVDGDGARVKVLFPAATGVVVVVDKQIEYKWCASRFSLQGRNKSHRLRFFLGFATIFHEVCSSHLCP